MTGPILILGATGFIGSAIAADLAAAGYDIRPAARDLDDGRRQLPDQPWSFVDLNRMTSPADWAGLLAGVAIIINASGLLQSGGGDDVGAVQEQAVMAMGEAASAADVRRIIQISAAGIDGNDSDFMQTKARADAALLGGAVPALVLRPGLVIGRNAYGGTQLVRLAAAMPMALLPPIGAPIRCIALGDVVAAVRRGVDAARLPSTPVDLVAEEALPLSAIIAAHRRWLGFPPWRTVRQFPAWMLRLATNASDALGWFGWRSPLRRNAIAALVNGVDGNSAEARQWLGRAPATLDQTLAAMPAGKQDRFTAIAYALLPAALLALGLMWALSGIATLVDLPRSSTIMAATGVSPDFARLLAIAGALADLLLAALLLWRKHVQRALIGMAALASLYLALGTLLMPGLWLDPLAPYAKVLPTIMLALIFHPLLEKR